MKEMSVDIERLPKTIQAKVFALSSTLSQLLCKADALLEKIMSKGKVVCYKEFCGQLGHAANSSHVMNILAIFDEIDECLERPRRSCRVIGRDEGMPSWKFFKEEHLSIDDKRLVWLEELKNSVIHEQQYGYSKDKVITY